MSKLPKYWVQVSVGEIVDLAPKNDCSDDTDVGFVPLQRLGVDYRSRHTYELRNWSVVKKGYTHFANGDVLLARITPSFENGKAGIVRELPNGMGAGSTEYFVCRPIEGLIIPEYLLAHFKTPQFLRAGKQVMSGAVGQQRVPKQYVLDSNIPLPPLPEQKRIADKLDAVLARVDACRERLDRVPGILKRFRQAVLAAATSGVLTEGWRGGSSNIWEIESYRISEIGDVITGSTPTKKNASNFGGSIPFFKPGDLDAGYQVSEAKEYLSKEGVELARLLPARSVMVTCIGATIGKTGISRREGATNQQINSLVCNESIVLPEYFYFWCCGSIGRSLIVDGASATTLPILNKSKFSALEIELPPVQEQQRIIERIESLFAYADHLEARYTSARAQVDRLTPALLAKAFRGELVPQDPNDEPASILLERISATRSAAEATASAKKHRRPNATAPTLRETAPSEPVKGHAVQLSIFAQERNQTNGNGAAIPEENLLAALRAIVRGEKGGLTETELLRGAASRLGFERLGKNIRTVLEHTLSTALHRRVVVLEEDRYVAATPTIARYDDTFLLASLSAIMRSDYEYKPDDIAEMMAGYLGYSAVTEAMRERIDGVVAEGLRVGVLQGKGGWVWREK